MLIHWIWLAARTDLKDRDKLAVLSCFRDPEDAYFANAERYAEIDGISEDAVKALENKDLEPAEKILQACAKANIQLLTYHDPGYPTRLKHIPDPPLVLYYKGKLPEFDGTPVIGVVGTRKASIYGLGIARRMGYQIAKCGGIVVSGMASGIDGAAMQYALNAGQSAVGVLGCGADVVYPASNRKLFEDVERYGCLISEFPPGTPPYKWNFPKRNRIISGMADGVLVVEAPVKSGALITARRAADQGRDLFVAPGNIGVASCAGSNALLREGAVAVSSGWDVVSEYEALYPDKIRKDLTPVPDAQTPAYSARKAAKVAQAPALPQNKGSGQRENDKKAVDKAASPPYSDTKMTCPALSETEQSVAALLGGEEWLIDDLIDQARLPAGTVLAALTMLQVKGIVTPLPGRRIVLKKQYQSISEGTHGKTI